MAIAEDLDLHMPSANFRMRSPRLDDRERQNGSSVCRRSDRRSDDKSKSIFDSRSVDDKACSRQLVCITIKQRTVMFRQMIV